MKQSNFFSTSYYFNVFDIFAFILFMLLAGIASVIVPILLLKPEHGVEAMANFRSFFKEGYVPLIVQVISYGLPIVFFFYYRRFRVRKEVDSLPLEPIFTKKIGSPVVFLQGLVFDVAVLIIVVPIMALFPESALEAERMMGDLDVYFVISAVLFAPFLEEALFRGVLLSDIKRRHGALIAVVVSSVIFALLHSNFHSNFVRMIPTMFGGFVFAYVFLAAKSIWPAILLHFTSNAALIFVAKFYPEESNSTESAYTILDGSYIDFMIYAVSLFVVIVMFIKIVALCKVCDKERDEKLAALTTDQSEEE